MFNKLNRLKNPTSLIPRRTLQLLDLLVLGEFRTFLSSCGRALELHVSKLKSRGMAAYRMQSRCGDGLIVVSHFDEELEPSCLAAVVDSYCCLPEEKQSQVRCIEFRSGLDEGVYYHPSSKKLTIQREPNRFSPQELHESIPAETK